MSAGIMSRKFSTDTIITDLDLAFGTAGLNFNQESVAGHRRCAGPARPHRSDAARPPAHQMRRQAEPAGRARHRSIAISTSKRQPSRRFSTWCATACPASSSTCPTCGRRGSNTRWSTPTSVMITATPELASLRNAKNIDRPAQAGATQRPAAAPHSQSGRRRQASGNSGRRFRQGARHRARPLIIPYDAADCSAPPRATAR